MRLSFSPRICLFEFLTAMPKKLYFYCYYLTSILSHVIYSINEVIKVKVIHGSNGEFRFLLASRLRVYTFLFMYVFMM